MPSSTTPLADDDYLVGNKFSVTDIIMAWPVNWARRMDYFEGMDNLSRYLDRLFRGGRIAI